MENASKYFDRRTKVKGWNTGSAEDGYLSLSLVSSLQILQFTIILLISFHYGVNLWIIRGWYLRQRFCVEWQDAIEFRISWSYLRLRRLVHCHSRRVKYGISLVYSGGLASVSGLARESWGPWRGYTLSWYHLGTWCRCERPSQRSNMAPL